MFCDSDPTPGYCLYSGVAFTYLELYVTIMSSGHINNMLQQMIVLLL